MQPLGPLLITLIDLFCLPFIICQRTPSTYASWWSASTHASFGLFPYIFRMRSTSLTTIKSRHLNHFRNAVFCFSLLSFHPSFREFRSTFLSKRRPCSENHWTDRRTSTEERKPNEILQRKLIVFIIQKAGELIYSFSNGTRCWACPLAIRAGIPDYSVSVSH